MDVVEQNPAQRLPGIIKDRHSDDLVIANLPKYLCPQCDELTVFSVNDARLLPSDESTFNDDELAQFNAASNDPVAWESVHCDFRCRICKRPIRVVCRMHEFAMGCYRYFPLNVYEIESSTELS